MILGISHVSERRLVRGGLGASAANSANADPRYEGASRPTHTHTHACRGCFSSIPYTSIYIYYVVLLSSIARCCLARALVYHNIYKCLLPKKWLMPLRLNKHQGLNGLLPLMRKNILLLLLMDLPSSPHLPPRSWQVVGLPAFLMEPRRLLRLRTLPTKFFASMGRN